MRMTHWTLLPLATALTLAGCGGGADNAATPTGAPATVAAEEATDDPCRYISIEEMSAITTDTVTERSADGTHCTYKLRHGEDLRVVVEKQNGQQSIANARRAVGMIAGMGEAVAGKGGAGEDAATMLAQPSDSPGVGDESLWGSFGMLYARKGDAYVEVYPIAMHDPQTHSGMPLIGRDEKRRISTTIARQLFARIGS